MKFQVKMLPGRGVTAAHLLRQLSSRINFDPALYPTEGYFELHSKNSATSNDANEWSFSWIELASCCVLSSLMLHSTLFLRK